MGPTAACVSNVGNYKAMADVLGAFEQAVLLGIMRLGNEAYWRAILKQVQARLQRDVAPGAVHAVARAARIPRE